jgi:hypothetical protein
MKKTEKRPRKTLRKTVAGTLELEYPAERISTWATANLTLNLAHKLGTIESTPTDPHSPFFEMFKGSELKKERPVRDYQRKMVAMITGLPKGYRYSTKLINRRGQAVYFATHASEAAPALFWDGKKWLKIPMGKKR